MGKAVVFGERKMILAGDVGGTKVDLALYDFSNGKLQYTRTRFTEPRIIRVWKSSSRISWAQTR